MSDESMQTLLETSYLSASPGYLDNLYEQYLSDPNAIPQEWRHYFDSLPAGNGADISHEAVREQFAALARQRVVAAAPGGEHKQAHVLKLIDAFRHHGHHNANLDPLGLKKRQAVPDLSLEYHQLSDSDLGTNFNTESALTGNGADLKTIYAALQRTYCDTLGVEFMHISDQTEVEWLKQRLESVQSHPEFSKAQRKTILKHITAAEGLERYLGRKYVGQKRFSLEGGGSLIPLLQEVIHRAGSNAVKEIVIGMAHRGRLNVMINVLGKSSEELFKEFEGKAFDGDMSGDVKYHMGFSSDVQTEGGPVHLALSFNPSHLEIIGPVAQGSVRSRQRRRHDLDEKKEVLPIIIHGDAAFAGQGCVMETFNFSQARGYSTGGSVHIVINNQIGFTTSNPLDARSTLYCTDVAKMVQAPVLHVNGDDLEMVVFAAQVALDYRMRFHKDIVIDMVCYRRHGHNEADDPFMTQPMMYKTIKAHKTIRTLYAERLVQEGVVTEDEARGMEDAYRQALDAQKPVVETLDNVQKDEFSVDWQPYFNVEWDVPVDTTFDTKKFKALAEQLHKDIPEDFTIHPQVKKLYIERDKMTAGEVPINWGYAETMAYATLLADSYTIRLSGQDSGRGTFAHRHAALHDYANGDTFIPLQHLAKDQGQFIVIDSVLSEEAVLAFEYGYATAEPNALVMWEAQFGDFANGAQVVVDQFISSGEQKWGRFCGLVMLLPHGYEGQGPEHSSARLERYLQLCAQHNMQVCVPSTPAQVYHMLRRQVIRPYRKPLIVMTPKSILRHKLAVSTMAELTDGQFQCVLPEIDSVKPEKVDRIILCSGKVYYELLEKRREDKLENAAILRLEQLYPFPEKLLNAELAKYKNAKKLVWCQEEPRNQGVWYQLRHRMQACLRGDQTLHYAGRAASASPAAGYASLHMKEQKALVEQAFSVN